MCIPVPDLLALQVLLPGGEHSNTLSTTNGENYFVEKLKKS